MGKWKHRGLDEHPWGALGVSALSLTSALGLHQEPEHHSAAAAAQEHHPEGREETRTGTAAGRSHAQKTCWISAISSERSFPTLTGARRNFPMALSASPDVPRVLGKDTAPSRGHRGSRGASGAGHLRDRGSPRNGPCRLPLRNQFPINLAFYYY